MEKGYYRSGKKLYSVDNNGVVHKLQQTANQMFITPEIWIGQEQDRYYIRKNDELIAVFWYGEYWFMNMRIEKTKDNIRGLKRKSCPQLYEYYLGADNQHMEYADFVALLEKTIPAQGGEKYSLFKMSDVNAIDKAKPYAKISSMSCEAVIDEINRILGEYQESDDEDDFIDDNY